LNFSNKNEKILKDLVAKFNGEGLTILPVQIEVQYSDLSTEIITVMISSLCEKNNRIINKKVSTETDVVPSVYSTGVLINEKKSIKEKIKNWFRY